MLLAAAEDIIFSMSHCIVRRDASRDLPGFFQSTGLSDVGLLSVSLVRNGAA